jgi:O-antigen/teichoic acid export membrane protein
VWMALFSRHIGPEGMGQYAFAQSALAILVLFVDLGLQTLIIRNVSRNHSVAGKYFAAAIVTKLMLSLVCYGLFFCYVLIRGWNPTVNTIMAAVSLTTFIFSVNSVVIGIFYAFEKMVYDAAGQIINAVLVLFIGAAGIAAGLPLPGLLFLISIATLVRLVVNVRHMLQIPEFTLPPFHAWIDWTFCRTLVRESLPFAMLAIVGVIYGNVFVLVLRHFLSDTDVGIFSAAQRLYGFLFILPQMFMNAVFPSFAKVFAESKSRLASMYSKGYRYIMIISIFAGIFSYIFAPYLVRLIFGHKFEAAIFPFQIMTLTLLNGVGYINGPALNAMGKEKFFSTVFGITMCATALACFFTVPRWGVEATCWILVAGHILGLIIYSATLHHWLDIAYPWRYMSRLFLAAIFAASALLGMRQYVNVILLGALITPAVFIAVSVVFRLVTKEDMLSFAALLPEQVYRRIPQRWK